MSLPLTYQVKKVQNKCLIKVSSPHHSRNLTMNDSVFRIDVLFI